MKMEQTECFETSAYKFQTPANHPKESIQYKNKLCPHGVLIFCICFLQLTAIIFLYSTHRLVFRSGGKIAKPTSSFVTSVCLSVFPSPPNSSTPTGRISRKSDICGILETLSRKFEFPGNLTKITYTLHEDLCGFMIVSC